MSIVSLLDRMKQEGIRVRLVDNNLKINAPKGKLTAELLAELEQKKKRVIEFLQGVIDKGDHIPVEPVETKEYYELSSAQKRIYFLQQMDTGSISYNMPMVLPTGKNIEIDRLVSTFKKLIDRHESLRTSFELVNEEPVQRIHEDAAFEIEYYNLATEVAIRPFDLSKAPLVRAGLIKQPDDDHLLMVDVHHIISDGISHTILSGDFFSLYKGRELEPLSLHYKDFSQWQNHLFKKGIIKAQEDYWLALFADIKEIPRLNVTGDYKRPEVFTFTGDRYDFVLEKDEVEKFRAFGSHHGSTLYMNILAVLNVLFYKYTGQTDIIIGSGIAGRSHADLQDIIGMFVNMLAMRNYPAGEKTYQSFLKEVTDHSIQAFENQDVQFEELVDILEVVRDPSRNPLFDIAMVVQNFRQWGVIGRDSRRGKRNNQVEKLPPGRGEEQYLNKTSKFDMTFFLSERGEEVCVSIEYYTGIFKEETIRCLSRHLKNVIKTVIKNPVTRLKDIEIISAEEKQQVLHEFNDTACEYPEERTIHRLFKEQAARTPDHAALIYEGEILTYRELDQRSNQVAHYLFREKGIEVGDRVGIWMSPSMYRPVSILGVLKAGAAYVPIDPSLPAARIKYMMNDASILVVISEKKFVKDLNRLQWECRDFHSYLCVDSPDIHEEDEIERNELMDEELWHHVGETAGDDISGGGWISSYTGEPLSREEMDEYGDNILEKLVPLLHREMRVLEIGCASGISMFRIAPRVGLYYGTDLSAVIIDKNKERIEQEGYKNINLSCAAAHEIDKIAERNFDLIIMNSVIQCFHGHNYLRKVIRKAVDLLGERGYLFIGDVMDQEKKESLVRELTAFKQGNKDKPYATKTDFSSELFVARGFWTDLAAEWREIERIEFTGKIYTIENELTKFRYDTLIGINKKPSVGIKKWVKCKYQDDLSTFSVFGSGALDLELPSDSLAYVIYTSGTTGQPKGVMIEHGSLVNLCYWHNRYYQITEADYTTQYAGFGFDASVWEMFPYLTKGAALHLIDDSLRLDIEALNAYYERNHISISFLPTQFCELFMEQENCSLRVLLTGGDKLRNFVKRSYDLYNNYGPTENTVVTTGYRVERALTNIPIGKPVGNNRVYILDREGLHVQPVGVPGELCIGGVGLARGYLNSPELTGERFVSGCYRSYRSNRTYISSKIIYITGDLARWLADGNLEFLGRIDQQVKIRGSRLELGEIENLLMALEGVKEAVVTAREDENGQKYLCAYIVFSQGQTLDISELRSKVSARLPDYMVPGYFMQLDGIPLTPAGKVDRRKLPQPGIMALEGYTAPRDVLEEKLVEIWADVLNTKKESIGINNSFFEMGGHSLKATILTARVHKELNVKIPLARVFITPTIKELAEFIRSRPTRKERHISLEPGEEKEYYALSSAQKRMYILQQVETGSIAYNITRVIPLAEALELEKLAEAFRALIRRHESLRTSFEILNGEPVQRIHREAEFAIEYLAAKTAKDRESIISNFIRPFDLSKVPLLRVGLIRLHTPGSGHPRRGTYNSQEEVPFILLADMHHIISDGVSHRILQEEFVEIYNGYEPVKLRLRYKDYSEWQNNPRQQLKIKKQQEYWLEEFQGNIPVLNFPTDYERPAIQSFKGAYITYVLEPGLSRRLKALAIETETTLFMVFLAVYCILLYKYTQQEDIAVGSPVSGRRHLDLQNIIGMFVNMVAIRTRPQKNKTFNEFLAEAKIRTLYALENQDFQFEELVKKLGLQGMRGRNPLFDVVFSFLDTDINNGKITNESNEPPDARMPAFSHKTAAARFDLHLRVNQSNESLAVDLIYSTALFKQPRIEDMLRNMVEILGQVADNREVRLGDIAISHGLIAAASQYTRERDYWLAKLQGNPVKTGFPCDYEPSAESMPNPGTAFHTGAFKFQLTEEPFERIMKLSKDSDAKLFMIITAGLSILLYHYTGHNDIIVGTSILKQDIEGEFVNTVLALRNQIEDDMTFKDVLVQVRQTVIDAFENQNYPIEALLYNLDITASDNGFPLFDTAILLENIQKRSYLESIRRNMTFSFLRRENGIEGVVEYNPALYKKQTPERIAAHFTHLLKQITANAHVPVSGMDIMREEEKAKILQGFNAPDVEYPKTETVYRLFEARAEKTPDTTAVVGSRHDTLAIGKTEKMHITYCVLNEKAGRLAHWLREKDARADSIIGIMMAPSIEMMIAILGILKTGAAYLPIDPDYPQERINYMLKDSGAKLSVTTDNKEGEIYSSSASSASSAVKNLLPATSLAYVLYTSGTTGKPKGVLVENRNLVNYVAWFSTVTRLTHEDRTILTSSFAFDLGYTSLYPALLYGGELHVLPREIYLDSPLFLDYIRKHRISYIKATPSFFSLMVNHPGFSMGVRASLRLAVLGGEPINTRDIEKAHSLCPRLHIMNHYGPTETTIGTVAQFIDFDRFEEYKTSPTIGRPIHNTKAYVLGRKLQVLPAGTRGELCISGDSLARGYLNDPEFTAEKFDHDLWDFQDYRDDKKNKNYQKFFGGSRGAILQKSPPGRRRLYRIGDLARWLENGNIEFLGRMDHQVKVRGFRIELEEIESQLRKHKDVNEAVVMVKKDVNGNQILCAYIAPESSNAVVPAFRLREFLSGTLPDYMLPSYFIPIEKMPLTPNGKIDRKKLPGPEEKHGIPGPGATYVPPGDDVEKKLVGIWAETLTGKQTRESIGIDDDFFRLGGHSLKATILINRVREELKVNVPLGELFRAPTIRMLAAFIRGSGIDAFAFKDDNLVMLKKGSDKEKHLFFIHAGSGEVEVHMEFCQHLDPDFNYWGIRADRLENCTPRKLTNEQVAAAYIEKIKKVRPRGPYYIVGWCIGGTIAFEMVSQLEQSKEEVGFFALINSIAPQNDYLRMDISEFTLEQELNWIIEKFPEGETKEKLTNLTDVRKIWPLIIDYLETSGWDKDTILDLYARAATNVREFSKTAIPNYDHLSIKEVIYYCNVIRTYRNVRAAYIPAGKINTRAYFFEARRHKIANKNLWSDYCSKPIAFYEVEGDHFSIFEIPEALEFARLFNRVFAAEKKERI